MQSLLAHAKHVEEQFAHAGVSSNLFVGNTYTTLLAVLVFYVFTNFVYRLFLHPLSKFPGPFEAKVSGSWRNRCFWRGTWHDDVLEVHKKYGPVVRVAYNELSIVDEDATKLLYNHGTQSLKPEWYATWDPPNASGPIHFSCRDKNLHSFLRKRVSAVYTMSAMLRYEDFMQSCLDLMMERLRRHADQDHIINMSDWTDALAFDVVGELGYGSPLGQLEAESDNMGIRASIHDAFYIMANMGHYWGQSRWLTNPVMGKIQTALGLPDMFARFRVWTERQIAARRTSEGKAERDDMLTHFLTLKTADGAPAGEDEILVEAMNLIGAGADTTSASMRSCLYYIIKHQDIYRKVQKEIDEYYREKNLRGPIKYQQTQELPILCASVREAMRLLPSITYPLLRYIPESLAVNGMVIPAETSVGVSPIAANRDPAVWGDDADEFNPSRWLGDERKVRYLNSNDMTFGGNGPRMCIGRNLALVELHKFLVQFLYHFDVEFADPEKPWRVHSQWFVLQQDMYLKLKWRGGQGQETSS